MGINRVAVILLVEDDAGDQELIQRALLNCTIKNDLHVVKDGEEALDYLYRRGRYAEGQGYSMPDLILLDLNLPRFDGRQFLSRIKGDPKLRRIPAVVLTTSQQEKDIVQSYDAGANAYVIKPATVEQIMKLVNVLVTYWFDVVQLPSLEN
ncbi:MAG: response regulator [Betaproteobacteria bacterium]|nr:response regulator [Betaproteobacteria bacterium]